MKFGFTVLCLALSVLIVCWAFACNATIIPTLSGGDLGDKADQTGGPADDNQLVDDDQFDDDDQFVDDDEQGPEQDGDQPGDGFDTNGGFGGDGFGTNGLGQGSAFDTNGG